MITKDWIQLIEKYSFIDKAEVKGAYFFIRYTKDNKTKSKRFPIRVAGTQLQRAIENIKKELGVKYDERKTRNYYII